MSAEIVDYLLVFWCVLGVVVFLVGSLYEKQHQELAKRKEKQRRRFSMGPASFEPSSYKQHQQQQQHRSLGTTNLDDFWPQSHSSGQYNTNYSNYSSPSQPHTTSAYGDYKNTNYPADYQQQPTSGYGSSPLYSQAGGYASYYGQDSAPITSSDGRQSPVGAGGQDGAASVATIPTATGFNADCVEWVNSILYLFYTQPEKYGPIICENVYRSLNEKLSNIVSSSHEHSQLVIEFEGINAHESSRPELTNIRTESESDKSISAQCKIYNRRISLNLSIRKLATAGPGCGGVRSADLNSPNQLMHSVVDYADSEAQVKRYELLLENIEGKLKSMAMLNEKLIVIQFIEKPDTKISLRPVAGRPSTTFGMTHHHYQQATGELISEDVLVQLILQTLTQVVVDLYFGNDADFPQYKHTAHSTYAQYKSKLNNMLKGSASELKRQLKHDLFGSSSSDKERRVFVKIVRAKNINYNQNVTCLMELDTPHQQAVSSTKMGSSEPFWDEHFLFQAGSDKSGGELTFELWDSITQSALIQQDQPTRTTLGDTPTSSLKRKAKGNSLANSLKWQHKGDLVTGAKFLGLARLSVDELRRNPVQKVSLPLQPLGPNDGDLSNSVGGELQLELLFMEHSANSQIGGTLSATGRDGSPLHKSNSMSSLTLHQPQGEIVSIDRKLTPSGFVITTTTITKQPQQPRQQQQQKYQDQLLVRGGQSPAGSSSMVTEHSFDDMMNFDGGSSAQISATAAGHNQQLDRRSEGNGADSSMGGRLSRSRSRSRSFLRAIKKRFSFSRTRSRSVGESGARSPGNQSPSVGGGRQDYESHSRASSEVSTGMGGEGGRAKSVPASRDPNEVPTIVINRGRLSDTASAFTFAHPKSQLIIEVLEPTLRDDGNGNTTSSSKGRYRYYAVPDTAASKRKWRKRGLKLHVFNEHQFVACHLAGSSTCHLCGRVFSRRPGKQGYKCRNCHLLSHKQCHVKVDHNCPYAKRDGLKLEYIDADPPSSLVDEMMMQQPQSQIIGYDDEDDAEIMAASHRIARQQQQYRNYQPQQHRPTRRPHAGRMATKSISVEVDDR